MSADLHLVGPDERARQATDRLILLATPVGDHMVAWDGPWPPPQRLAVIMQGSTGRVGTVTEAANVSAELLERMRVTTLRPIWYVLRNASAIEQAASPAEHWFRGAEYVRDDDQEPQP